MNPNASADQTASPSGSPLDPFDIIGSSLAVQQAWLRQPERLYAALQTLAQDSGRVHERFVRGSLGIVGEPAVAAVPYDERFQDGIWTYQPGFAFL